MAYLTTEQRDQLKTELENMSFNRANGKLKRMDDKGRMAFYRNAQRTGHWMTKYVLTSLGTEVTLVESNMYKETDRPNRVKTQFNLTDVIVEPTPDNRS
jgi:hypothetical protein